MASVVRTYSGCKIHFKGLEDVTQTQTHELQTKQGPVTLSFVMNPSGYNCIDEEYVMIEVKSNKAALVRSIGLELILTYQNRGAWWEPLECGKLTNAQSNLIYLIKLCKLEDLFYVGLLINCQFTWQELAVKQEGCKDGGLAFDQGELLKSGKLSDFTIRVGKDKFACHKSFLAARLPVFERMLLLDMAENKTGEVTITDISPENVADMLSYIYTDQVDQLDDKARELLAVSDKYCLNGLKGQCGDSLIKQISLETVADLAILADLYSVQNLRSEAISFIVEHRDQLKKNKSWVEKFQNNPAILMEVVNALL